MSREKDIRKSNFVAVTSIAATDYFDIVRNGQNHKITAANMLAYFGVSGPLETRGEVTATPVLVVSGGTNYIRNLIAGDGIGFSLSAQDAIEINHSFAIDKTGVPIILDELSDTPDVVSLVAGSGISITAVGTTVEIAASGPAGSKLVEVYDSGDLPAASLGVITLADDTEYLLLNDISLSDRIVMGDNTVLAGSDSVIVNLTYTGVGVFITATDKNIKIRDLYLTATGGTLFDWDDTVGNKLFRLLDCGVNCLNIGDFNGGNILLFHNVNFYNVGGTGFTFAGSINVLLMTICGFTKGSGAQNLIDLNSATFYSVTFNKILFAYDGTGYCISGLTASGNISAGGIGTISNILQLGSADILNNISPFDNLWEMQMNPQIYNSYDEVLATRDTTNVVIAASATPVVVGATWTAHETHRFTATAGGRFTYTGKGSHMAVTATISGSIVSATDNVTYLLYKNGNPIAASAITREFTAGTIGNMVLVWSLEMDTNDYLELWVQNDDTSVDITISKITLRINS